MQFQELFFPMAFNLPNGSGSASRDNSNVKAGNFEAGNFEAVLQLLFTGSEGSTGFAKVTEHLSLDNLLKIKPAETDMLQLTDEVVQAGEEFQLDLNIANENNNLVDTEEKLTIPLAYYWAMENLPKDVSANTPHSANNGWESIGEVFKELQLQTKDQLNNPLETPKPQLLNLSFLAQRVLMLSNIGTGQEKKETVNMSELDKVNISNQWLTDEQEKQLNKIISQQNDSSTRINKELLIKPQITQQVHNNSHPNGKVLDSEVLQKDITNSVFQAEKDTFSVSKDTDNKGSFLMENSLSFAKSSKAVGKQDGLGQQLDVNLFNSTLDKSFNRISSNNLLTSQEEVPIKELPEFLLKQINTRLLTNKLDGSQELSIKLKPAELGKLSVQVTANNGQVAVKILTENNTSRELLEQNLVQLKHSLTSQGIKCGSIDVQVGTDSSFNQFMGHQFNPFNHSRQSNKHKNPGFNNGRGNLPEQGVEQVNSSESAGKKQGISKVEFFA